jgi:hypothetical protein
MQNTGTDFCHDVIFAEIINLKITRQFFTWIISYPFTNVAGWGPGGRDRGIYADKQAWGPTANETPCLKVFEFIFHIQTHKSK